MSGIAKAVKKTFKSVSKVVKKAASAVNNVRKKIMKSKIFKTVAIAATVYFGGAALVSMAGSGTASAGLSSAWGGLTSAGSKLAAGNFSGAFSALSSGFTGGGGVIASNAANIGAGLSTTAAPSANALNATLNTGLLEGVGGAGLSNGALTPAVNAGLGGVTNAGVATATAAGQGGLASMGGMSAGAVNTAVNSAVGSTATNTAAGSGGLLSSAWNGLGEAGKAAVITSGVNMAGQALQGKAQQEAAEQERKRRTYWGVDGEGNQSQQPGTGLLNIQPYQPYTPASTPGAGDWRTTIDDLINRTKQTGGGY